MRFEGKLPVYATTSAHMHGHMDVAAVQPCALTSQKQASKHVQCAAVTWIRTLPTKAISIGSTQSLLLAIWSSSKDPCSFSTCLECSLDLM